MAGHKWLQMNYIVHVIINFVGKYDRLNYD